MGIFFVIFTLLLPNLPMKVHIGGSFLAIGIVYILRFPKYFLIVVGLGEIGIVLLLKDQIIYALVIGVVLFIYWDMEIKIHK